MSSDLSPLGGAIILVCFTSCSGEFHVQPIHKAKIIGIV